MLSDSIFVLNDRVWAYRPPPPRFPDHFAHNAAHSRIARAHGLPDKTDASALWAVLELVDMWATEVPAKLATTAVSAVRRMPIRP